VPNRDGRAHRIVDKFTPEAKALRRVFDERFADPRSTRGDRFVWDYWHVPGQYTALRTPAWQYFPGPLYRQFHRRLVHWGRRTLGCHDVSPPWLSLYIDGCGQQLHGDLPHGPFAFVYSLTQWQRRRFTGGETLLLRDEVLEFWSDFVSERSVEEEELLRAIPPRFDRLTVFDPRIPHGVRTVTGTRDPREGRLVIHGWFVQPRPFVEGPVPVRAVAQRIADLAGVAEQGARDLAVAGVLSFGIAVAPSGNVREAKVLADTTRVPRADEVRRRKLVKALHQAITAWKLPARATSSQVTLPLVFSQG
jgi:hypothetical protein